MKTTSALSRARDRLNEHAAERALRPRAVCAVCGGVVKAGEGDPLDWGNDTRGRNAAAILDAERAKHGRPPLAGWGRLHSGCGDAVKAVFELTGERVSPAVAGSAIARLRRPIGAAVRTTMQSDLTDWTGEAWAHVVAAERDALAAALRQVRNETEPRRCVDGACAWCGRAEEIGARWRESPEKWSDATAAPLCGDCAGVWDRRGNPSDRIGLRTCALEALSGASGMNMWAVLGEGMRTYCDLSGDDHSGHPERWAYAPDALTAIREDARLLYWASLDEPKRTAYRALVEASSAARDARQLHERVLRKRAEATAGGWPVSA